MSEYQIIQFEGCPCVVITLEYIEAKDAELARLRSQLAASEAKRKVLAEECLVGRDYLKPHCYVECGCVFCRSIRAARAATDAACALEDPR